MGIELVLVRTRLRPQLFLPALIGFLAVGGLGAGCSSSSTSAPSPYCQTVNRLDSLDLFSDVSSSAIKSGLAEMLRLTRRAARVSPSSIQADAMAAVVAQEKFNGIFASHDWDFSITNLDPAFTELSVAIETSGVYLRLEEYRARACAPAGTETA